MKQLELREINKEMMKIRFNIMGFNQEILTEKYNNLNGNDLIVLRTIIDTLPRMTRTLKVDGKEFKQLTYDLILKDIPFVTKSLSTIKKIVQKLIDANLIERYVENRGGKFTYFKTTNDLEDLKYEDILEGKNTKKVNVDSNGQKPLDGQIGVEEALEEVEKEEINKIIKATGATEEEAREELRVAKSKEGIKDIIQYTIGTINNKKRNEKELEKTVADKKQEINPKSFNNFPAREYDYDDLERKLLGWDKDEEEEQEIEFLN